MSKAWCFTLNNYVDGDDKSLIANFKKHKINYLFAEEVGESGTKHYQGYIYAKTQISMDLLKTFNTRMHLEKAKGDLDSNVRYCTKEGGNFHSNFFEKPIIIKELYDWQLYIVNMLDKPADDRTIHWVYDEDGNIGKSALCKYLVHEYDAIYLTEGQKSDLINIIYNAPMIGSRTIIAVDIPRANGNVCSYKAFEEIKNGVICNTKYETGMRTFNSPHVICFSNSFPDVEKMSEDRWNIMQIIKSKDGHLDPIIIKKSRRGSITEPADWHTCDFWDNY